MTSVVAASGSALPLLASADEATRQLPMPAVAYAAIAFGAFLLALAVLWSFRNTAAKWGGVTSDDEARARGGRRRAGSGASGSSSAAGPDVEHASRVQH